MVALEAVDGDGDEGDDDDDTVLWLLLFTIKILGLVVLVGEAGGVGLLAFMLCNPGSVFMRIIAGSVGEAFGGATLVTTWAV